MMIIMIMIMVMMIVVVVVIDIINEWINSWIATHTDEMLHDNNYSYTAITINHYSSSTYLDMFQLHEIKMKDHIAEQEAVGDNRWYFYAYKLRIEGIALDSGVSVLIQQEILS